MSNLIDCKFCGNSFVPKKYSHDQVYCSKKCNKKAYYYSPKGQIQNKNHTKRTMVKYHNDKDYNKIWKERTHAYETSQKGRLTKGNYRKKYRNTPNGKLSDLKYRKSSKRKLSLIKYTKSAKGKSNSLRASLNRRAALNSVIHNFTYNEWIDKVKATNGICKSCNIDVGLDNLTLDHIYPISLAYKDYLRTGIKRIYTINDVQCLCLSCNISKNNKIL